MKSILDIENNREKCQKFTPLNIVENMLDMAKYNVDLMGKKILENSFGSGHILKNIVRRYIQDSLNKGISPEQISAGIENDIYGVELDETLYKDCIVELDKMIKINNDGKEWYNIDTFYILCRLRGNIR